MRLLCEVLEVSRSSFYAWCVGKTYKEPTRTISELACIRVIHREHKGRYGAPRITRELRAQGHVVNHKRVAKLMREAGLAGMQRRRFRVCTTDSNHSQPIAENLLKRQFTVEAPNRVIVGDITYLEAHTGWLYLAVLLDLYSRKVVGWAVDTHMETSLCLRALKQAVASRRGLSGAIHHSDRGSQYASHRYRATLERAGLKPSMSRKGNCWDNAVAESFFGTLKQELRPKQVWRDIHQAKEELTDYIHRYYNSKRRHSTLGYLSPIDFENRTPVTMSVAA